MKIGNTGPVNATRVEAKKARKAGGSSASGFASMLDAAEETEGASSTQETAQVAHLNPMLALQEVSDADVQRKQAVRKGKLTLDALEQLRDALLRGSLPSNILPQLEKLVKEQRHQIADPRLQSILDDIELRAAVEIAKLEMAQR